MFICWSANKYQENNKSVVQCHILVNKNLMMLLLIVDLAAPEYVKLYFYLLCLQMTFISPKASMKW